VTIKDAGGIGVPGVMVTFTAPPQTGPSGTFAGSAQVTTDSNGVATATIFTANGNPGGPYNVTATTSGLTTVSFALTNRVGTATQMTANANTTPQSATTGAPFGTLLGVTVKDSFSNPVQGVSVTFTAPPQTGPSGTFANTMGTTSATTDASGIATATAFTANANGGGPYNVVASATGLSLVSFALTNNPAAPAPVDISAQVNVSTTGFVYSRVSQQYSATLTLTNTGGQTIAGPISVAFTNLPAGVTLVNATASINGSPYVQVLSSGSLTPGQAISVPLRFTNSSNVPITFTRVTYSGL
jgi:hypothetical protein